MQLRMFIPAALGGLLLGCASAGQDQKADSERVAEEIQTILTQPLAEDEYVQGERCLSTYEYDQVEILDNRHVLFHGRGDKVWLNTLKNPCVGLRKRDPLEFEIRGSQLCNMDDFNAISQQFMSWTRSSASCVLGDFVPVTKEQVVAMRDALEKK